MAFAAQTLGALIGSYFLLRILMFISHKLWRPPYRSADIAALGLGSLAIATILGGYGMQDNNSEPVFLLAFFQYFGPTMAATVIEMVRSDRRESRALTTKD